MQAWKEWGWFINSGNGVGVGVTCTVPSHSVMSDSLRPPGLQPTRLLCSQGFFREEYWSRLTCLPSGDHPNPGIEPRSPTLQADSLLTELPGSPGVISVQLLSPVRLFAIPWTAAHQASLCITNSSRGHLGCIYSGKRWSAGCCVEGCAPICVRTRTRRQKAGRSLPSIVPGSLCSKILRIPWWCLNTACRAACRAHPQRVCSRVSGVCPWVFSVSLQVTLHGEHGCSLWVKVPLRVLVV